MAMNSLFPDPNELPSGDGGLIANVLRQYAAAPPDTSAPLSPIEQQMMGMTGPNQPVSGLGPQYAAPAAPITPAVANANASADDNDPIPVGGYSMPRVGAGFPDNTAPAPQRPAAPAAMPNLGPPASEPGFMTFSKNLQHGGGLLQSIVAGVTGQRNDAYGEAQAQQRTQLQQQVQALISAGVPRDQAVLAVLNPEAAKTIIPQALSNKQKFAKIGQDGLGREQYGFVDENAQTVNGKPLSAQPQGDAGGGLGDMSLTGPAYLATVPPKQAGIIKAMVEGRQPQPSGMALAKPYWQSMMQAAQTYDPTFDQTNWPARVKGMTNFRSGADAGTVRSANQVLGHISDLTDKADELHNGDYPLWNAAKNTFNSQTGADAGNNWVTQAHAVADELSAFMKGAGHSSDTEIHQWQESLSPNMSPQQQRGAIKTLMGIYDHALSALEDKRTGAIGSVAAEKLGPLVTPAGQAAMDKVRNWAAGSAPGAPTVDRSAVEAEMKRRGLL